MEVFAGEIMDVEGQVDNQSTGDLADAEISLFLVDAETDTIVDLFEIVDTVTAGDPLLLSYGFETLELPAGLYRVELRVAGDFEGTPYDLELARQDVVILAGLEIPTLGPSLLLLMTVLLATAGASVLRRRPGLNLEILEMSQNATDGKSSRRSSGRLWDALPWLVLMFVLAGSHVYAQDQGEGQRCSGHFPALAEMARAGRDTLPAKSLAIERELAIERVLWEEEINHQRDLLARAGGEVMSRVDAAESQAIEGLGALSRAIREKTSLSSEELKALLRCTTPPLPVSPGSQ